MSKSFSDSGTMQRLSRSRSRSATQEAGEGSGATAAECSELLKKAHREPQTEEEPKLWMPQISQTMEVESHTHVGQNENEVAGTHETEVAETHENEVAETHENEVAETHENEVAGTRASIRPKIPPKDTLQKSIHVSFLERAEALGLDQEEGEEAIKNHFDHIQKWLGELKVPECIEPPSIATNAAFENVSVQSVAQSTSNFQETSVTTAGDVRPSTSGMVQTSARIDNSGSELDSDYDEGMVQTSARIVNVGSELDSDYDDEFDMDEFAASTVLTRDIPDDSELEEPERNLINKVARAMDDAVDRMTNVSTNFTWQDNFDTFRGVAEKFSGPNPGPINDYDTAYEAFTSIWSRDFIERIVLETNRYARQTINEQKTAGTLEGSSRLQRWTDTSVDEIYSFLAICICMGLVWRVSEQEYWQTTGCLELPMFRQCMSYNRFVLLNKFIHFAENSDASQNLPQSGSDNAAALSAKLAEIAPVLEHLNAKFSKLYNLQQDIAIDESLTLFEGRLSWLHGIRSMTSRFGIKSYELCESGTGYLWKFDIYTGNDSVRDDVAPSVNLAGKSIQVVLDLLKGLENRGHLVTMDNFYNCPALARYLKSLGFDCLGTLRPNRRHVPVEIRKAPKNVPQGTVIARHSGDLTCIAYKDTKMVYMISTYHTDETFVTRKAGRDLVKPIALRDYNSTMGGIDLKDRSLAMYPLDRQRSLEWCMKMFKRLLNISVLNAFIMLTESLKRRGMPLMTHRNFRHRLVDSLVERHCHLSPEENTAGYPEETRLRKDIQHVPNIVAGKMNRKRCVVCSMKCKAKKVNLKCIACGEFMCPGQCWSDWHYRQQLPDTRARRCRRRH